MIFGVCLECEEVGELFSGVCAICERNIARHIEINPNNSEAIEYAYSRGLISFETMKAKLKALRVCA